MRRRFKSAESLRLDIEDDVVTYRHRASYMLESTTDSADHQMLSGEAHERVHRVDLIYTGRRNQRVVPHTTVIRPRDRRWVRPTPDHLLGRT